MDERARVLLVTGSVLLVLLAIISGTIFYFAKGFQNRKTGNQPNAAKPSASVTAKPSLSPLPDSQQTVGGMPGTKIYQGAGFQFFYPEKWGLLTCSNSQNIELDPANSTDFKNAKCEVAQKPVTVLVGSTNCNKDSAETITLGGVPVIRSKTSTTGYTKYRWCIVRPALDITHRVSSDNSPATSKDDFSAQVEEMISKMRFGIGS